MTNHQKIRVLLVDDDKKFCNVFAEELHAGAKGLDLGLEFTDKINGKHGGRDLYICTQNVVDTSVCIETIEAVRNSEPSATIFVVAEIKDFKFMKELMKRKVSGYIDKNNLDLSGLLEEARTIFETRVKVGEMVQKMNHLEALNRVV